MLLDGVRGEGLSVGTWLVGGDATENPWHKPLVALKVMHRDEATPQAKPPRKCDTKTSRLVTELQEQGATQANVAGRRCNPNEYLPGCWAAGKTMQPRPVARYVALTRCSPGQ